MLALAWMDKKQVTVLSTIHRGPRMVDLPPNHKGVVRTKPLAVLDYNKGKVGVDVSDQMAVSYATRRKCVKWYQTLFCHLVDTVVVNACLLARVLGNRITQKKFRLDLIRSLLGPLRGRPQRHSDPQDLPVIPKGHFLVSIHRYRRCKQCSRRGKKRQVKLQCAICDIGLHAGECFVAYHTA